MPILLSFFASLGGAIGEFNGYYIGYLGKKLVKSDNMEKYKRITRWLEKNRFWTVVFLAFLPILPYNLAGLAGGVASLPPMKLFLAIWLGKFPKFIILCYIGVGFLYLLPPGTNLSLG